MALQTIGVNVVFVGGAFTVLRRYFPIKHVQLHCAAFGVSAIFLAFAPQIHSKLEKVIIKDRAFKLIIFSPLFLTAGISYVYKTNLLVFIVMGFFQSQISRGGIQLEERKNQRRFNELLEKITSVDSPEVKELKRLKSSSFLPKDNLDKDINNPLTKKLVAWTPKKNTRKKSFLEKATPLLELLSPKEQLTQKLKLIMTTTAKEITDWTLKQEDERLTVRLIEHLLTRNRFAYRYLKQAIDSLEIVKGEHYETLALFVISKCGEEEAKEVIRFFQAHELSSLWVFAFYLRYPMLGDAKKYGGKYPEILSSATILIIKNFVDKKLLLPFFETKNLKEELVALSTVDSSTALEKIKEKEDSIKYLFHFITLAFFEKNRKHAFAYLVAYIRAIKKKEGKLDESAVQTASGLIIEDKKEFKKYCEGKIPKDLEDDFKRIFEQSKKKCTPCAIGVSALKGEMLKPYAEQLFEGWTIFEEHHLEKKYTFKNFREALAFTNHVGKIAEEEGHHPNIFLSWGEVTLQIWTHKVNGLTESDFILASKIEVEYISHQG